MNQKRRTGYLPVELITEIQSRLPAKSLGRFKCVSKEWRDLIEHQNFVKLHLRRSQESNSSCTVLFHCEHNSKRYDFLGSLYTYDFGQRKRYDFTYSVYTYDFRHPQNPAIKLHHPEIKPETHEDTVDLIGSCNGLVCLFHGVSRLYFMVYNPITRAYRRIPIAHECKRTYDESWFTFYDADFYYDCVSDDYKVLLLVHKSTFIDEVPDEGECWKSNVFSLKANSWIRPQILWDGKIKYRRIGIAGVANNYIHWMSDCPKKGQYLLSRLNISTEEYDVAPLPNCFESIHQLSVLNEKLHIITKKMDIWVWKEYGVKESSTRLFQYPLNLLEIKSRIHLPFPCAYSKERRKILVSISYQGNDFICCDLDTKQATRVEIPGLQDITDDKFVLEKVSWIESLVSP